jgi:PncC family amidohydrolase
MAETTSDEVIALARTVGERLSESGLTFATAESCTGGLIGHLITEIPGCSEYFAGAAVVYSYEAKERVLGVDHDIIVADGAVSYAVAGQMARGAWSLFGVDLAVAVTGIAGPGGGMPQKPVGTVHIHVSAADGYEQGRRYVWNSDRSGNKLLSARAALTMALDYLVQRERSRNGQRSPS